MLHIVFDDSTKACLTMALGEGLVPGCTAGDRVAGLPFRLDMGEIAFPVDSAARREEFLSLAEPPYEEPEGWWPAMEEWWEQTCADLAGMRAAAAAGEPLCLWYSDKPGDACGFAFCCQELLEAAGPVLAVKLPEWEQRENVLVEYASWSEMSPEEIGPCFASAQPVPPLLKNAQAALWQQLCRENAPLRAVVSGRLVSVEEDFYDPFLRRYLPEEERTVAWVIGTTLGRYPLGIGDTWYHRRIRAMIAAGELEVTCPHPHPYEVRVRKAKKAR